MPLSRRSLFAISPSLPTFIRHTLPYAALPPVRPTDIAFKITRRGVCAMMRAQHIVGVPRVMRTSPRKRCARGGARAWRAVARRAAAYKSRGSAGASGARVCERRYMAQEMRDELAAACKECDVQRAHAAQMSASSACSAAPCSAAFIFTLRLLLLRYFCRREILRLMPHTIFFAIACLLALFPPPTPPTISPHEQYVTMPTFIDFSGFARHTLPMICCWRRYMLPDTF